MSTPTLEDAYASGRADEREEWLPVLEALRRFATATLTPTGVIVGLMREDFERARAAIARATGEPKETT